jgi:hypothetical protein
MNDPSRGVLRSSRHQLQPPKGVCQMAASNSRIRSAGCALLTAAALASSAGLAWAAPAGHARAHQLADRGATSHVQQSARTSRVTGGVFRPDGIIWGD